MGAENKTWVCCKNPQVLLTTNHLSTPCNFDFLSKWSHLEIISIVCEIKLTFLPIDILQPCFMRVSTEWLYQCWWLQCHKKTTAGFPSVLLLSPSACFPFVITIYRFVFWNPWIQSSWIRIGFFFKSSDAHCLIPYQTLLHCSHPPTACEHVHLPDNPGNYDYEIVSVLPVKNSVAWLQLRQKLFHLFTASVISLLNNPFCPLPIFYWGFTFFFTFKMINV